jgi:FeS assembly protein IscX
MTWDDIDEIVDALYKQFPGRNPMEIRFTDLHRSIVELEGFTGDPRASSEGKLEAIQMAWWEEFRDGRRR